MIRKNYRRKRISVRKSTRKSSRRSSVSTKIKRYVKRQIHKNIETKKIFVQQGSAFGSVNNNTSMYMFPMLPQSGIWSIPLGVTQGNRVGNKIAIRKVVLRYTLNALAYDAVSNTSCMPCEVDMFLGNVKRYRGELPTSTDIGSLFDGGSTSYAPVASLIDLTSPINTDYWDIKKRWRHKVGNSDVTGSGAQAGAQYFANNDFKLNVVRTLNITKHCPKTVTFNDSNQNQQGPNLYFFYQAIFANNNVMNASQTPLRINYNVEVQYEDA